MKLVVNARFLTQNMTGVQRYAVEICLELKRMMGDDIEFVAPNNIEQKEYAQKLSVKIIGNRKGHFWEQIDLPCYLKRNGNPLLLCLCNTAPLFYKNKIVTVHDVAFEAYPQTFNKVFLYTYRFLIPRIIRTALKVITVSQFSKDEINKYYGIDKQKIEVVFSAVADKFHIEEDEELKKHKYFLAVSSLNYRKNFLSVLQAFDIFEKKCSDVSLYIIGDLDNSNFKNVDTSRYHNDHRIKFLGRVSDDNLVKYYSNAMAFVFPSIYEGFGLPPLEAQSCGCPVLVSDIPPHHEVVEDSGFFCNPYKPEKLAKAMLEIGHYSEELKRKGFENIKRFSFKKSAQQIYNIILDCSK